MSFAVIDVETTMIRDGEYPRTLFWGFADANRYERFESTAAFLKFLRREPPTTLLHHSNFDVLQLLLDGAKVQIKRTHNARLIRCGLYKHELLNSFSVFPLPLAQIFDCFGFQKSPLTCNKHAEPKREETEHERNRRIKASEQCRECGRFLAKRNYDDCRDGLTSFLRMDETFLRLVGVSPLERGTIAGTSFRAAQMCAGAKLPIDERFLESYRGGRVEVFNTSLFERAHKYDINSSYPYSFIDCPERDELLQIDVRTEDYYCPFFDALVADTLLFPNGTFQSWVFRSNMERYLEDSWTKTSVRIRKRIKIDFSWLKAVVPLVEKLYRLKNESKEKGNTAVETACKLLLNSLYGRIGLRGESERCRILDYFPDGLETTVFRLGPRRYLVFDTVYRETKSNFPFAAFITDNARARLYRAFVGGAALYGDTDSVITAGRTNFFNSRSAVGGSIGQWKFEGQAPFQAINVKDYLWGEDEIRKGGDGYVQWTLKTFASGKRPREINRERISELRKRVTTFNGETLPHVVNR